MGMKDRSMTVSRPLGWSAAASALLVGGAHLAVTGGTLFTDLAGPTPEDLAWVLLPAALALIPTVAAIVLVHPSGRGGRWPLWTCGITAALTAVLAVMGLTPLFFGANPLSLFQGPGPYALLAAILFTALTLSVARTRRTALPASSADDGLGSDPTT